MSIVCADLPSRLPGAPALPDDALPADDAPSSTAQVLGWLLGTAASASDALADRARGRVLEVSQLFGDAIVAVRHFGRGAAVHVGAGDFEAPVDLLPTPDHTLFAAGEDGWVCTLDPAWPAFVEEGGARLPVGELMARGVASLGPDGLLRLPLGEARRVVVEIGHTVFVAQPVFLCRPGPLPSPLDVDRAVAGSALAMVLLATLAGIALGTVPEPPRTTTVDDDHRVVGILLERVKPPAPAAPAPAPKGGGDPAPGDEGAARPNPQRPGSVARRHTDREIAQMAGVLGALQDQALDAVLGQSGLGGELTEAIGGLIGSNGTGGPGLGRRGPGLGGGGTVAGIGDIGPRGPRPGAADSGLGDKVGGVLPDPEDRGIVLGSLDRAQVDAVIKANLASIRYCYQRELQRSPGLGGKVTVRFTIAGDGSVSQASTKSTTLGSPAAESCINGRILRLGFPKPRGGGLVIVSYPFVFAAA